MATIEKSDVPRRVLVAEAVSTAHFEPTAMRLASAATAYSLGVGNI